MTLCTAAMLALVRRHEGNHLLGARGVATGEVALGEPGQRRGVLLILLQDGSVGLGGALKVACLARLIGCIEDRGNVGFGVLAQSAIDERTNGALGLDAHEAVERPAVAERVDGGQ